MSNQCCRTCTDTEIDNIHGQRLEVDLVSCLTDILCNESDIRLRKSGLWVVGKLVKHGRYLVGI